MSSEDLECNTTCLQCFYTACLWSLLAINTCDCTYICLLRVLYCSEMGSFRVGGGVRRANESIHLNKIISIFYKCIQTIQLRQTTENNGGPCKSKMTLKGYQKVMPSGPD